MTKDNNYQKDAVVLVHGLNTKYEVMKDIEIVFINESYRIFRCILAGHDGNYAKFRNATLKTWLNDLKKVYSNAYDYVSKTGGVIVFAGFSIGALINLILILFSKTDDISYKKMFLFAPPISLRYYVNFFKFLKCFSSCSIKSLASYEERANKYTPISAYLILFDIIKCLNRCSDEKLNIDTEIFIDPKDEFVSYRGINNFIRLKGFSNWKVNNISKSLNNKYHHLVVKKKYVMNESWIVIEQLLRNI